MNLLETGPYKYHISDPFCSGVLLILLKSFPYLGVADGMYGHAPVPSGCESGLGGGARGHS